MYVHTYECTSIYSLHISTCICVRSCMHVCTEKGEKEMGGKRIAREIVSYFNIQLKEINEIETGGQKTRMMEMERRVQ